MRKSPRRSAADFTDEMIAQIFERDGVRCLRCGSREVTIQHRRGKGMGGLGKKATPLTPADGLLLCAVDNEWATNGDVDAAKQFGWTVERKCPWACLQIPYFDAITGNWWYADDKGERWPVSSATALQAMRIILAA